MNDKFLAGCLQLCTGENVEDNLREVHRLAKEARAMGVKILFTPEHTPYLADGSVDIPTWHPRALSALQDIAKEMNLYLHTTMAAPNKGLLANRSYLINDRGEIVATYDKIHLFDAHLPNGEVHSESKHYIPGKQLTIAKTPFGLLGMAICFDVRFAQQFIDMRSSGAHLLSLPSAFTAITGQAHWHILVRARAIETGCYLFAPNQAKPTVTYGHSLIIGPWGEVLAEAPEGVGLITAPIEKRAHLPQFFGCKS